MLSILTSCSDHWTKSYSIGLLPNELIISSILISILLISIFTSAAAWFISGSTFEHKMFELKKGQFWGSYRFYYQEYIFINKPFDEPILDTLKSYVMEYLRFSSRFSSHLINVLCRQKPFLVVRRIHEQYNQRSSSIQYPYLKFQIVRFSFDNQTCWNNY